MTAPIISLDDDSENWLNLHRQRRDGQPPAADDQVKEPAPEEEKPAPEATGDGVEVSTDEEETIAEAVAAYRAGEIPFDEALKRVAETSLTWHEAQILLADEDPEPA